MAFKIDTQAYKENHPTQTKPKNPTKDENSQNTAIKNPPPKKPIGDLESYIPPTSNSAFSSLFLSHSEWLQKEFNLSKEAIISLLKSQDTKDVEILEELQNLQNKEINPNDSDSFLALLLAGLKK
ncbi:hypothetical protein [Helicobacter burdigaliensis]|uniref:hypothetical protein n=1 Tax=Helicobacter burdigaliensis TaxID=2315334 RepID=UPI000EF73321|nr:hypothetical protein [Helicobacter burdigaliensis]